MGNCIRPSPFHRQQTKARSKRRRGAPKPAGPTRTDATESNAVDVTAELTPNEKTVEHLCEAHNSRSVDILKDVLHPCCFVNFKDLDVDMTAEDFMISMGKTWASFPDMRWTWSCIKEVCPGTVKLSHLAGRGTHTGEAYEFPPYPAIPTSYKKVSDPPVEVTLIIKDGKITKIQVNSFGRQEVGPAGFYSQIGGIIF